MAARKRRRVAEVNYSEMDDLIAEIDVGDEDEDEEALEGASAETEEPTPDEEPEPQPEPEVEAEEAKAEPEKTEPEPKPDEAEEPAQAADESEDAEPDTEQKAEKRTATDGLRAELEKLRSQNRTLRMQMESRSSPRPLTEQPAGLPPVETRQAPSEERDEDGYIVFADGTADLNEEKLARFVREVVQPTPQEINKQQYESFRSDFLTKEPEHAEALQRAELAQEFVTLSAAQKMRELGLREVPQSLDAIMDFLDTTGVTEEVGKHFPELMPTLPDLLYASEAKSVRLMSKAIREYSRRLKAAGGTQTPEPSPRLTPLPTEPTPSLSQLGSSNLPVDDRSKARMEKLEKEFRDDPLMDEEHMKELDELHRKFGIAD